uniref:transcription factor GTE3, chloroplastic-like n=1 Tax=Erigeron canadensis TaxID=72917 RepID=UPI001CB8CCE0|nr:transcription factor GTE3, chloroplastic-like [Erigeron canadensis]XP_043624474.1 transcription factor GTE3, chloroplastic-like [Erigeron canadensis]
MESVTLDADKINKPKVDWENSSKKVYTRKPKKVNKLDTNHRSEFVNPLVVNVVNNRVKINLKNVASKNETRQLSKKLKLELDQVRGVVQKLENKKRNAQAFKSCSNLLQRLMKHKNGWVFNEPVDAEKLGLFDYHDFIKQPMDLGTIKERIGEGYYKFPKDFAEDVRLTFRNAMTYNSKGHGVHVMAEQLLGIFEDKWALIEAECNADWSAVPLTKT